MKIKLLIIFQLFMVATLIAEKMTTVTIFEEVAVKMALENNLSLQSAMIDLKSSRLNASSNWNVILPEFNLNSGFSRTDSLVHDSVDSSSWAGSISFSADLKLNAASALHGKRSAISYEAQLLNYEANRSMLILNVRKQFHYILAYKEYLVLQERNLDLAQRRYLQAETNHKNGRAPELTVLEAQYSYESLKPVLQEAKTIYESQLMVFKKLLGIDLEKEIIIEGNSGYNHDVMADDAFIEKCEDRINMLLMNRHDVQSALKEVAWCENQEAIIRAGSISPVFSLSADWTNTAPDIIDPDWGDYLTVSAYLTIPLNGFIPGSSTVLAVKHASNSSEKARINLHEVILEAEQEIRIMLMELNGHKRNIEKNKLNVELAKKTYEMTESAYLQGVKEVLDVKGAQNNLFSAEQNLILSRYNYLSGILDLGFALNIDVEIIGNSGE